MRTDDGHTAILLGVASVLSQLGNEFKGEIRLIFSTRRRAAARRSAGACERRRNGRCGLCNWHAFEFWSSRRRKSACLQVL